MTDDTDDTHDDFDDSDDFDDDNEAADPFSALLGGGGGGGFGGLLAQAQAAMEASQAAASTEVEGSAGGGLVKIRATGGGDVLDVTIAPAAVDPDDIEGLQDLVLAALRDVNHQVARLHDAAMGGLDPSALLGGGGLAGLFGDTPDPDGEES